MQMAANEYSTVAMTFPKGNYFTLEFFYKGDMTSWTDGQDGVIFKKSGTLFFSMK
jgi:hypothetical protein